VILLVPIAIAPDIVPPARGSLVAILLVTVVAKLGSSPRAAASSFRVSRVVGEESIKLEIDVST